MSNLGIVIKLLIGSLHLVISEEQILWYWEYEEKEGVWQDISVINLKTDCLYKYDETTKTWIEQGFRLVKENESSRLINKKWICQEEYLGYSSNRYLSAYEVKGFLNGRGNAQVITETVEAKLNSLNAHLTKKNHRAALPFIGNGYLINGGFYTLESYEVTHAKENENRILISKVIQLKENKSIPEAILQKLENLPE